MSLHPPGLRAVPVAHQPQATRKDKFPASKGLIIIEKAETNNRNMNSTTFVAAFILLSMGTPAFATKSKAPSVEPDFTKGEQLEVTAPWALGATGAFGNIWYGDQRMIRIASVAKGSPADGQLNECDVLLGVLSPTSGNS